MQLGGELYRQLSNFLKFLEVTTCIYAILRKSIKCNLALKNGPINVIYSAAIFIIATLITMVLYVLLAPLLLYKILVTLMLAVIHRGDFGGLLNGADVAWFWDNAKSNNTVNYLLIIQFSKSEADLLEYVREVIAKRFLSSTRLTCTRQTFMGYQFLLKNQLNVDDVVRLMDGPETLRKIVQDNCNKPFPKNDTAAWELLVRTQPIDSDDQYPLLIRIHHSISDGITFLSLLAKQISDEKSSVMNVSKYEGAKIWGRFKNFFQLHSRMVSFNNPAGINELTNPNLSLRKNVGFYVEHGRKYLRMVKEIRKRAEGASFSSVILTAMSASLEEYFKRVITSFALAMGVFRLKYESACLKVYMGKVFETTTVFTPQQKKKAQAPPEDLFLTFTVITDRDDLKLDHPDLANLLSLGHMKLPIAFDGSKTLFERLLEVTRGYTEINQSHDLWIQKYMNEVFLNLFPVPALLYILKMISERRMVSTIAFSNLPGFPKIHIGGNALKHLFFFIPNYLTIGVGFSLITYDDRLQMGLMVDEVIIPEEDAMQEILDGIFKHIDMLYKEIV